MKRVTRRASIRRGKWNVNLIHSAIIALFQFGQTWTTRFVIPKLQFASCLNLIRGINCELHALTLLLFLCFVTANLSAATPSYVGSLDVADCNHVSGWAGDQNAINKMVKVNLYVDGKLSKSVIANLPRKDVADAGYGPNHGFEITLPATAKNGVAHSFAVRVTGAGVELWGSPRSLTCAKPTPTPRPSPTPKPSPSPSATPKPSPNPSVTPSPGASPSPTATASPTAPPAPTATPSPTPPVAMVKPIVSWLPTTEPNIAGRHVLIGGASGQYTKAEDVPDPTVTSIPVPMPAIGKSFVAMTAYNTDGAESSPSAEASYDPAAPLPSATPAAASKRRKK